MDFDEFCNKAVVVNSNGDVGVGRVIVPGRIAPQVLDRRNILMVDHEETVFEAVKREIEYGNSQFRRLNRLDNTIE